jgi:hypothetical protein
MLHIKFNQKFTILEACWVKRDAVLKDNTDKLPFAVGGGGWMSDEKEPISAANDGSDEVGYQWNRRESCRRRWWQTVIHDGFDGVRLVILE